MTDSYAQAISMIWNPETSVRGVTLLRELAEDGDTRAMCDYGRLFNTPGAPVTQNGEEAFKWYLQAAEYGDDRGQFYVGESYYNGVIIARDYIQASKWFNLSAEKGYAIAQYYLGDMYYHGNGVPIDKKEAMRWFTLSVDRECNEARIKLADIYCENGSFTDFETAYKLYSDAMADGYAPAFYKLGMMNYEGHGRPINLKLALKFFRAGVEKKDVPCTFMIGKMYYLGEGILKDTAFGIRYLNIADDMGSKDAKEFLNRIDHTRKNTAKWGDSDNLIRVEQLLTPDLLSRPPKENRLNVSVSEETPEKKVGLFGKLFGRS